MWADPEFETEPDEVTLKRVLFSGPTRKLVVPDYITTIRSGAIVSEDLEELWLGDYTEQLMKGSINCPNLVKFVTGYKTVICDDLFARHQKLQTVIIRGGTIGYTAFLECNNLTELTLSEGVKTIGTGAFARTGIVNLTVPSTVENVGDYAFAECPYLRAVQFSDISMTIIGVGAFSDNPMLKDVHLGGTQRIGESAFIKSGVERVVFEDGLLSIGNFAFAHTLIRDLDIVDCEEFIGIGAFEDCLRLKTVVLPQVSTQANCFKGCIELTRVTYREMRIRTNVIEISGFNGCTKLRHVLLPDVDVSVINEEAFLHCLSLRRITIPHFVTEIRNNAFRGCSALRQVRFPDMLRFIGEGAFKDCVMLHSAILPLNVRNILDNAFAGCTGLTLVMTRAIHSTQHYDAVFPGCKIKYLVTDEKRELVIPVRIGLERHPETSGIVYDLQFWTPGTHRLSLVPMRQVIYTWMLSMNRLCNLGRQLTLPLELSLIIFHHFRMNNDLEHNRLWPYDRDRGARYDETYWATPHNWAEQILEIVEENAARPMEPGVAATAIMVALEGGDGNGRLPELEGHIANLSIEEEDDDDLTDISFVDSSVESTPKKSQEKPPT